MNAEEESELSPLDLTPTNDDAQSDLIECDEDNHTFPANSEKIPDKPDKVHFSVFDLNYDDVRRQTSFPSANVHSSRYLMHINSATPTRRRGTSVSVSASPDNSPEREEAP